MKKLMQIKRGADTVLAMVPVGHACVIHMLNFSFNRDLSLILKAELEGPWIKRNLRDLLADKELQL